TPPPSRCRRQVRRSCPDAADVLTTAAGASRRLPRGRLDVRPETSGRGRRRWRLAEASARPHPGARDLLAPLAGDGQATVAAEVAAGDLRPRRVLPALVLRGVDHAQHRSEEHTSELQSRENIVCRLLLEKK